MINFIVAVTAAGKPHTKSRKSFQNHEYIHIFIGLRKVNSINSEVLKERRLYSTENKKEYTQKQKKSWTGVVYTKK